MTVPMGVGTAFLWYCAAGGMLGAVFDLFRLCRRMIHHSTAAVVAEDLMFALALFLISFYGLVTKTNGVFRWFFLAGETAGFFLYLLTVSRFVLHCAEKILRVLFKMLLCCKRFSHFLFGKIHFLANKLIFFTKNSRHGLAKQKPNDV